MAKNVELEVTLRVEGAEDRIAKVTITDTEFAALPGNPLFKQAFQLLHLQISEEIFYENTPKWRAQDGEIVEIFMMDRDCGWTYLPKWLDGAWEKYPASTIAPGECLVQHADGAVTKAPSVGAYTRV